MTSRTPEEVIGQEMKRRGFDTWTEPKTVGEWATEALDAAGYVIVPQWVVDFVLRSEDDDPCSLDHHGYCQAHWLEEDCSMPKIRAFAAMISAKEKPAKD
jgi:hypothetical protein